MIDKNYVKSIIMKFLSATDKKVKLNYHLQKLYNSNNYYDLIIKLQEYNIAQPVPFLASGMSCYFNDQVDKNGLTNVGLSKQDIEDAKFIAFCFGKTIHYSDNNLSLLYTSLLGTSDIYYGMQTFPAGIFEDVFQCSPNHSFPIQPILGESELDFYCRILDYQISQDCNFPLEKRNEVLIRAKRLIQNFCNGKNRIYLIPFENVLDNKASFGDVCGLRDGNLRDEELNQKLDTLPSFEQLLQTFGILDNSNLVSMYNDPNMTSEYGIAIYGQILNKNIFYFEVDRIYEIMQKKAIEKGYDVGELIPMEIMINPFSDDIGFSK